MLNLENKDLQDITKKLNIMKKAHDLRNLLFKALIIGGGLNAINICTLPDPYGLRFLAPMISLFIVVGLYLIVSFVIWAKYEN